MAATMIGQPGTDVTTKNRADISGPAAQPAIGSRKAAGEILSSPPELVAAAGSIETTTGAKAVTRSLGRWRSPASAGGASVV
jgi:hypothetical protein